MCSRFKLFLGVLILIGLHFTCGNVAFAELVLIEPDNFAEGANLNQVSPLVDLAIHDGILRAFPTDFGIVPAPNVIPVTALTNVDIFGGHFTSTGTKSFGHAGIPFTSLSRAIGMRFNAPVNSISIDIIGRESLQATVGILEIYDASGTLLDSVSSAPLLRQGVGTLTIGLPVGNIGYARAYSNNSLSNFGAFDNLRINTVPEPNLTLVFPAIGAAACCLRRRQNEKDFRNRR